MAQDAREFDGVVEAASGGQLGASDPPGVGVGHQCDDPGDVVGAQCTRQG